MKRIFYTLLIIICTATLLVLPVAASAQEGDSVSFEIYQKSPAKLLDSKVTTNITFEPAEVITIETASAFGIMLKWQAPCSYNVEFLTEDGQKRSEEFSDTILNRYIDLGGAKEASISLPEGGTLCDIEFYDEEPLPDHVQIWQQPYEKLDILLISAHPDDEYLYFGGTLPYYGTQLGLNVNCVWLSHQKRLRQDEALRALWAMGIEHYPEFVGFPDRFSDTYERGAKNWGEEETLKTIVELYRKYKPEVVITHDPKGEYGHGAHMLTSAMALEAAKAAADEMRFPESADEYGVWQIKKLYLHLLKMNEIYIAWDEPMDAFDGKTGMEMAKLGYSYHESQHIYNLRVSADSRYACTRFGLAFSTVGIDIHGGDFLENIAEKNLSTYVEPQPETVVEEEPAEGAETPEEKPEATVEPAPPAAVSEELPENTKEPKTQQSGIDARGIVWIASGAVLFAAIATVIVILIIKRKKTL